MFLSLASDRARSRFKDGGGYYAAANITRGKFVKKLFSRQDRTVRRSGQIVQIAQDSIVGEFNRKANDSGINCALYCVGCMNWLDSLEQISQQEQGHSDAGKRRQAAPQDAQNSTSIC